MSTCAIPTCTHEREPGQLYCAACAGAALLERAYAADTRGLPAWVTRPGGPTRKEIDAMVTSNRNDGTTRLLEECWPSRCTLCGRPCPTYTDWCDRCCQRALARSQARRRRLYAGWLVLAALVGLFVAAALLPDVPDAWFAVPALVLGLAGVALAGRVVG